MIDALTSPWLLVSVAAAGSAVAAWYVAGYAAVRNLAQPVDVDVDAETRLLDLLEQDPAQWLRVQTVVTDASFTSPERADRYRRLDETLRTHAGDLTEGLDARRVKQATVDDRVTRLRARVGGSHVETAAVLDAGRRVAGLATGRALNTDRSPLESTGDEREPLARRFVPATRARRYVVTCLGALLGAFAAHGAVIAADTHTAEWLAVFAVVVYVAGGTLIGLVDYDTFYLDVKPLIVWAAATWTLTAAAGAANHWLEGVLFGLTVGAAAAFTFELVARLMAYTTGRTQGMGDTFTVFVTAGVPAGLTGLYHAGLWSVLAASLLVVAGWAIAARRQRPRRDVAVPFVPYLVAGGLVAIGLYGLLL